MANDFKSVWMVGRSDILFEPVVGQSNIQSVSQAYSSVTERKH